jgi:adenosylhomocysteine nucleosidase
MIGIIGAMDEEIALFLEHLENKTEEKSAIFIFYKGTMHGKDVVIVKSGIGKVFAAMVSEKLIDKYNPEKIIFTGVAGSLNNKLEIGDVVVGEQCCQHDMHAEYIGAKVGQIPFSNYRFFAGNASLIEAALSAKTDGHKIQKGTILTGDQFITAKEKESHKAVFEELQGDCVEMEGAAFAQVCTINDIPHVVIRSISDKADGSDAADFEKFKHTAAENSYKIVDRILASI